MAKNSTLSVPLSPGSKKEQDEILIWLAISQSQNKTITGRLFCSKL